MDEQEVRLLERRKALGKRLHYSILRRDREGSGTPALVLVDIEDCYREIAQIDAELAMVRSAAVPGSQPAATIPALPNLPTLRSLGARSSARRLSFRMRVDREVERTWFRETLQHQNGHRGAIVSSESGWGKSVLLNMFKDEGEAILPTKPFFFDPSDNAPTWKDILDETVNTLGRKNFPRYARICKAASPGNAQGVGPSEEHTLTRFQAGMERQLDVSNSAVNIMNRSRNNERNKLKHQYDEITDAFIQGLEALSAIDQIVWLVDGFSDFDVITQSWIRNCLWMIAKGKITKLILVVACNGEIEYNPYWDGKLEHIRNLEFRNYRIVMDLLHRMGLYPCEEDDNANHEQRLIEEIKYLLKYAEYKPFSICFLVESTIRAGASDA